MDLHAIRSFLNEAIGLDADSIGAMTLRRAVEGRMSACGSDSVSAYQERLRDSEEERQTLIDSIVVPETWFFRDQNAFAALANWAYDELQRRPAEPLRLLSLPCSTGEEPYSIAMALLSRGIPAGLFRIDAVDISRPAIACARRAEYGRNSFRGSELQFRERYFVAHGPKYRLRDEVRSLVDFRTGNLFSAAGLGLQAGYDAIFCRNVLIYFDRAGQARAVDILRGLLRPTGLLFVAPAEAPIPGNRAFTALPWPGAFAFRRAAAVPAPAVVVAPSPKRSPPKPPPKREQRRAEAAAPASVVRQAPQRPESDPAQQIAALADQGRLDDAEACALRQLESRGPSAQVYYWLGVIDDARGRSATAATHYRRALYLDPRHREALAHLALLLDKQGQAAAASALRGRIRRLEDHHAP